MSHHDLAAAARANDDYRREVTTTPRSQVVLMTVQPGDEIGMEVHDDHDQLLVFVEGTAEVVLGDDRGDVGPGSVVYVPGGTRHNVVNTGDTPLRIVTSYAPPEHEAGTVHPTKADEPDEH